VGVYYAPQKKKVLCNVSLSDNLGNSYWNYSSYMVSIMHEWKNWSNQSIGSSSFLGNWNRELLGKKSKLIKN